MSAFIKGKYKSQRVKKYENGELLHHEQTQINQRIEQDACTKMYHK